jgi:hypothetical protein
MCVLDIKKAKEELKEKSYLEIQRQTAITWASRAAASYNLCAEEKDVRRKVAIYQIAEEYCHEGVEHAALCEDHGKLLAELEKELDPHRDAAADSLDKALKS